VKRLPNKTFAEPAAFVARQFRRNGLRHFLFTGARTGEGTTTTVLGISLELHLSYSLRVLALEINPHNGFKAALNLEQLPTVYTADTTLAANEIRPALAGFSIMSLGREQRGRDSDGNSAALLGKLLKSVENEFDVVLIDAPPVLERPEALAAAPEVDGVVLVVEAGRTRLEMLGHMRRMFIREELNVIGSILTKQEYAIPNWFYRLMFKA